MFFSYLFWIGWINKSFFSPFSRFAWTLKLLGAFSLRGQSGVWIPDWDEDATITQKWGAYLQYLEKVKPIWKVFVFKAGVNDQH